MYHSVKGAWKPACVFSFPLFFQLLLFFLKKKKTYFEYFLLGLVMSHFPHTHIQMLFNIDSHTEAVELQKTTVLFNYLFENSAPWWTQWLEDSGGAEGYYRLYPIVNESSYKSKFGRSLITLSGQSTHKHKRNCIIICFSIHTLWHHLLLYYNLFLSIFPLLSFFFFFFKSSSVIPTEVLKPWQVSTSTERQIPLQNTIYKNKINLSYVMSYRKCTI